MGTITALYCISMLLFVTCCVSGFYEEHEQYTGNYCHYQGYRLRTILRKLRFINTTDITQPCPRNSANRRRCTTREKQIKSRYVSVMWRRPFSNTACCPGFRVPKGSADSHACTEALGCFISLPQGTPRKCQVLRQRKLQFERLFFTTDSAKFTYFTIATTPFKKIAGRYLVDQFFAKFMTLQNIAKTRLAEPYRKAMIAKFGSIQQPSYRQYIIIRAALIQATKKIAQQLKYFRQPSWLISTFPSVTSPAFLNSDDYFAQMRLAGMAPTTLKRVYDDNSQNNPRLGMALSKLRNLIGRTELATLIKTALNTGEGQAVRRNLIYISDFPELRNIPSKSKDAAGRTLLKFREPLALFASVPGRGGKRRLKVLAIQEFYGQKNSVRTPQDGHKWLVAKIAYHNVESLYRVVVEKIFQSNGYMEQFCLAADRQLSDKHPLNAILKYHCRGIIEVNRILFPTYLAPRGILTQLYPITGPNGIAAGLKRAKTWSYRSRLHNQLIQDRGVDDKRALPFYPYRDDSAKVIRILKNYGCAVVDAIYKHDRDVVKDTELQNMVDELSAKGKGKVKGLPSSFKTKHHVCELMEELFEILVRHAAVNYALYDYGSYTPLYPASLFNGDGKTLRSMLPNTINTIAQTESNLLLSGYRLGSLLDYREELPEESLKVVTRKFRFQLDQLSKQLLALNIRRGKNKYLPYPYVMPSSMPNSIHV